MNSTKNLFLNNLNNAQKIAVEHFSGPLLVVAGAGSGKTRALTHRIAHLLVVHSIDPSEILAVTFTNKAAREMKERLEVLLSKRLAENQFGQPFNTLSFIDQRQLRERINREIIRNLWIGTFHALFARLLRYDIEKLEEKSGLTWTRNFSIYDERDALSLIKEIITQDMQLDPKRFEPKKIRWAISNAKNEGLLPDQLEEQAEGQRGKLTAEAYRIYRRALSANNALDFDDLLLIPVELLKHNEQIRGYWHNRFKHVLVDEYQDTNHTQYELIKLIVANGRQPSLFDNWDDRSVFVVGDADQSIYSFRAADFRILMGFQDDFSGSIVSQSKSTLIKLEENYRSTSTILEAANSLIENNKERIDKVLRATRGKGELIKLTKCQDEIAEAEAVVHRMRLLNSKDNQFRWSEMAVLYRTNAQSRAIEESLVRWGVPYVVVGGLRFYDRREIKDILAYLRLLINPSDTISLLRILNVPKRGIGKTTIQRLSDAANQLGIPLWKVINDPETVRSLGGRSAKSLLLFSELINSLVEALDIHKPALLIPIILDKTGYLKELIADATDEAEERRRNLEELVNAAIQYQEENDDADLEGFLASAALASDVDNKDTLSERVTLMTLHSSKGLEFPVISLVGMEQGLFPSYRSLDNPSSLEEERRLCYVGLTRAKERLFLSHASERRTWGGMREPALPSLFLSEIPSELLIGDLPLSGGVALRRDRSFENVSNRVQKSKHQQGDSYGVPSSGYSLSNENNHLQRNWVIGEKVIHATFGEGEITHTFGSGSKMSIAVKFIGMGPKILDPKLAPIEPI